MAPTPAPPRLPAVSSPQHRRRRKDITLTVVTITVVVIICAVAGFAAWAMANSWWTETDPAPSADQQLDDGQSRFDRAGVDFFTRQGVATVHLDGDTAATDLGLDADGERSIEPLVPIDLNLAGSTGTFSFGGVDDFVLTTAADRVTRVDVVPAASGSWRTITTELRNRGAAWGWSEDEIAALESELGDASRSAPGEAHTASLRTVTVDGIDVEAIVTMDADGGAVTLRYVLSR